MEDRRLLTTAWHNPALPADVDYSGAISIADALAVVNMLLVGGNPHHLPVPPQPPQVPPPFVDVVGDAVANLADVLAVVTPLRDGLGLPPPGLEAALAEPPPVAGDCVAANPTIVGRVTENRLPETHLVARLNQEAWVRVELAAEGSFSWAPMLTSEAVAGGLQVVRLIAQTFGGGARVAEVEFTLCPTLAVDLNGPDASGTGSAAAMVEGGGPVALAAEDMVVTAPEGATLVSAAATIIHPLPRLDLSAAPEIQFLLESANLDNLSRHDTDRGEPIVPLYTDFLAGGAYGLPGAAAANVIADGNDPDAAAGRSSFRITWTGQGANGFFDFGLGSAIANRPRDLAAFGAVREVRFFLKGDSFGQQVRVNVFRTLPGGAFQLAASEVFTLTTAWSDQALHLPAGLRPQDLHSVQFVLGDELNTGNRTIKVDELRLSTGGADPLRLVQSYRPAQWAPGNAPPGSVAHRDAQIYPNRAFLYDQALTILALLAANSPESKQVAEDVARALIATASADGSYHNERASGHALQGDGSPRAPFSQLRTLGDNAWLGLAFLQLFRETGDVEFLDRARAISDWAETHLKAADPWGGYRGGFAEDGQPLLYRATEHNLDVAALNRRLAAELAERGDAASGDYFNRFLHASEFVLAMFDDEEGRFWTGTGAGDDINRASVPLDAQLWAILALSSTSEFGERIDWRRPLTWAENALRTADGVLAGFRFSSGSTPGRVWLEGTAHAALVYHLLGEYTQRDELRQTLEDARRTHPHGDGKGVVAASSDGLADPAFANLAFDARLHVSATAWTFLAMQGFNPFTPLPRTIERLAVDTAGTALAAHYDDQTGVLTLSGEDSPENYRRVLSMLTYDHDSQHPQGERRVEVTIRDGQRSSSPALATIALTGENDPPVLLMPIPYHNPDRAAPAEIGQPVSFVVTAHDPENLPITFALSINNTEFPPGANRPTLDAHTGRLSWTPDRVGQFSLEVTATDNQHAVDRQTLLIDVTAGAMLLRVAEGALHFLNAVTHPETGFPHNEAEIAELRSGDLDALIDRRTFVPAQLGAILVAQTLAHALRVQTQGAFVAGPDGQALFDRLSRAVASLRDLVLQPGGNTYRSAAGRQALFQTHRTNTGSPHDSNDFDRTVSLLDNVQLMTGLQVAANYARRLAHEAAASPAPAAWSGLADEIDALLSRFDVAMWYDGNTLRLGNAQGPLGADPGNPAFLNGMAKLDRITSEGRLAPVAGLALGHLTREQFASTLDYMLGGAESRLTEAGLVERLPFEGTALEIWAMTPYLSGELATIYGADTLLSLVNANVQAAHEIGVLPAAGATGIGNGLGAFLIFGHTPAEKTPEELSANQFLDAAVLAPPAAGMMAGAAGTPEALTNLYRAVQSLEAAGWMDPEFGAPNYLDFGAMLVSSDPQVQLRGTLEIGQMAVALLNRLLGGEFVESVLRDDAGWNAALDAYRDFLHRRLAFHEGENVLPGGDGASAPRENASREMTWRLDNNGQEARYRITLYASGDYVLSLRYSNHDTGAGDVLEVLANGVKVGELNTANTGDWNVFRNTASLPLGPLAAGQLDLTLRLKTNDGFGIELDRLNLEAIDAFFASLP